ncbi:MAG: VWA domain-containing protein [Actinomycetota bacterium]|nr:VWA domain-containing protein [Actinomycetota bacterium]
MAQARRRTTSRRDLARSPLFEQVSPEVGVLDEAAVDDALRDDPDEMLALLADLAGATDVRLRDLARRLAGRLFIDFARRGPASPRGVGALRDLPYRPDGGDLDLDASLEAIVEGQASAAGIDAERLRVRGWVQPSTALCLLVDRSGSMGGSPLATAALAAAAVACRAPADYSVLAFSRDVVVAKSQLTPKAGEQVLHDVLSLRGFGTTDLAGALLAAGGQLARSRAGRKVAVLLSDCRSTVAGDPVAAAACLGELVIVAPHSDSDEAEAFARLAGARCVTVTGPSDVADALTRALARHA